MIRQVEDMFTNWLMIKRLYWLSSRHWMYYSCKLLIRAWLILHKLPSNTGKTPVRKAIIQVSSWVTVLTLTLCSQPEIYYMQKGTFQS